MFEFLEADGTECVVCFAGALVTRHRPIHQAIVVDAVAHSEHVDGLVRHRVTRVFNPLVHILR